MPARRPARSRSIVLGVARVALGRADGIDHFGNSPHAFLTSLAPLVAFPIVGTAIRLLGGAGLDAVVDFFATICALLAPSVLSYEFARVWRREASWLRFATAFNWCQWILPFIGSLLLLSIGLLQELGLSESAATVVLVVGLGGYGLWLHWFLARHALELSTLRAMLLVLSVNVGTVLIVLGPRLLLTGRP